MLSKFKDFIYRDVENENETKKSAVIIRINSLLMGLYFICLGIALLIFGYNSFIILSLCCLLTFLVPFYLTYQNLTKFSAIFMEILMIACILVLTLEFGWYCGAHYFIFTVLVMNVTTRYASMVQKILFAAVLGVFQLGLYRLIIAYGTEQTLSAAFLLILQIINTFFLFLTMIMALSFFSKDSMTMENKLIQYNEKMHHLASVDPLTGLLNRRSMKEYLEEQQKLYLAGNGVNISVALGDIDFFKKVNDTYGHDCGDEVLKYLARLFEDFMADKGRVSRWGGEEFLFVFYDCNGDDAYLLLDSLMSLIRKSEIRYGDLKLKITLTMGLEEINYRLGIEEAINESDKKLYIGKESGRNKVVY